MSNKLKNTKKRFKQGRTTYAKLKTVKQEELAIHMAKLKEISDSVKERLDATEVVEQHVHDDTCHHFIKHGNEPEEHIHSEDCNHP